MFLYRKSSIKPPRGGLFFFKHFWGGSIERFLFYSQRQQTLFLDLCFIDTKDKKKRQLFDQNHRLTVSKNANFFLNPYFYCEEGWKTSFPKN